MCSSDLDKGVLKLADGNSVRFDNTMIFMTSNLGAKEIQNMLAPKFGLGGVASTEDVDKQVNKAANASVNRHFSPEFINRIDEIMAFAPLSPENIYNIVDIELE